MKEEIMEHIKNLKAQGINVKIDENQINDLINKISDIKNKDKKNIFIDSEIDKFLKDYGDENIKILVTIKIKINLVQKKLLNHLKSYIIS